MDRIDLNRATLDPQALRFVGVCLALAYRVVPLYLDDHLHVAVDHENLLAWDDLRLLLGRPVHMLLADREPLERILSVWCEQEFGDRA